MKKLFKTLYIFLIIGAVVFSGTLISMVQQDEPLQDVSSEASSETSSQIKKKSFEEYLDDDFGGEPYIFLFDEDSKSAQITGVRFNPDYKGEIHLIIPEKSPSGKPVTDISNLAAPTVFLPMFVSPVEMEKAVQKIADSGTENADLNSGRFDAFYALYDLESKNITDKTKNDWIGEYPFLTEGALYLCDPSITCKEVTNLSYILQSAGFGEKYFYEDTEAILGTIENAYGAEEHLETAVQNLYYNAHKVTELTIPDTVTTVSEYTLYGYDNLKKVNGLTDDLKIKVSIKGKTKTLSVSDERVAENVSDSFDNFLKFLNTTKN